MSVKDDHCRRDKTLWIDFDFLWGIEHKQSCFFGNTYRQQYGWEGGLEFD